MFNFLMQLQLIFLRYKLMELTHKNVAWKHPQINLIFKWDGTKFW
jgi:hypothetical protein